MIKGPCEIFGYPVDVTSGEAQAAMRNHWCPFVGGPCSKKTRLVDYPMGVCSVVYRGESIAICPVRFRQNDLVFRDVAMLHFRGLNNLVVFSEVAVRPAGSFDFVIVKHRPLSSDVEGFAIVEFQTGGTTSTGRLVQALRDAVAGEPIEGVTYGFGMNYADIWKRSLTQVLTKGIAAESWGERVYWVLQEQVYRYLVGRYKLGHLRYNPDHSTVFLIYDMQRREQTYQLVRKGIESATVDRLFRAFRRNLELPSKEEFVARLQHRLKSRLHLALRISRPD